MLLPIPIAARMKYRGAVAGGNHLLGPTANPGWWTGFAGAARFAAGPAQGVEKCLELFLRSFALAPSPDCPDIHLAATTDFHRCRKALPIVPIIESCESVPAGIRGR